MRSRDTALRRCLTSLLLFALLVLTSVAGAQSKAVELAREGKSFYDRGEWAEALERFEAAERDAHSPVIVLFSARCLRNLGRLTEAKALLGRTAAEELPDGAPAPFANAKRDAAADLEAISSRIPTLKITQAPEAKGWSVAIDGSPIDTTTVELDPGSHVVTATEGTDERFRKQLEMPEGGEVELVIAGPGAKPTPTPTPDPEPDVAGGPSVGVISGATLVSFGGAALVVGTVLRVIAVQTFNDVKDNCDPVAGCRPEDEADFDRSLLFQNVSTGLFIGGAVVAATGIVLFFALDDSDDATETTLRISPMGLSVQGRF